jgi:hypothetical protein
MGLNRLESSTLSFYNTTMSTLLTLPDELLCIILAHLNPDELATLSRTCRRLRGAAGDLMLVCFARVLFFLLAIRLVALLSPSLCLNLNSGEESSSKSCPAGR